MPRIPESELIDGEVVEVTRPFVAWRKPLSELARVVLPATFNVPVAVIFAPVRFPLKNPFPATSNLLVGLVVPMPTLPPRVARYVAPVEVNEVVEALPREVWPVVVKVCEPRLRPAVAPVYGTYVAAAVPVPSNPNDEVETADTAPLVPQRRPERDATDRPPVVVVPVMERLANVGDDPVPMA
jgi:hypothetical protein